MEPLGGINEFVSGIDLSFDTSTSQDRQSAGQDSSFAVVRDRRNTDATGLALSEDKKRQIEELKQRDQAAAASAASGTDKVSAASGSEASRGTASTSGTTEGKPKDTDSTGLRLSDEEKQQVEELKLRDQEVRTHEQAHVAASGSVSVSGPSYSYEKGADGRMYATGGEVQIDTSAGGTPEETIQKAQSIRAAANAPAQPSGQDRSVAAQASQMESEARKELQEARQEEQADKAASDDPKAAAQGDVNKADAADGTNATATAQAVPPMSSTGEAASATSGGRKTLATEASSELSASAAVGASAAQSANGISSGNSPIPSYGVSGGNGWVGPTSGYLQHDSLRSPRDANAQPSQQLMSRAAMAYQSVAPSTALAPAGTGISLAV